MTENKPPTLRTLEDSAKLVYGNGQKIYSPDVDRCQTPEDVIQYAQDRSLSIVDYKFVLPEK